MVEIDGSYGEGGGQILRTALSLSCLYRMPFRIFNIRKGRKKPGLMPQHLTAVRAARLVSAAEVVGDCSGSTELSFSPREVKGGEIFFDIGTAGSTSLVLQTLIPALALGSARSRVTLTGGTHVPLSPSFHYLAGVFAPVLASLGVRVELSADSFGFYPRGGGTVRADIYPVDQLRPLRILERGSVTGVAGCSAVGNLPLSIATRQRDAALSHITDRLGHLPWPVRIEPVNVPAPGKGTFLFLRMATEHAVAGFTALGALGKRAETVGEEAARELVDYYSSGAPIDEHLADQLVLYLSLCRDESAFVVARVTHHLLTNLWVIGQFRKFGYRVDGDLGGTGRVRIHPRSTA
jgi:RNA 3'-terminal phosphate cyclase (ATP)